MVGHHAQADVVVVVRVGRVLGGGVGATGQLRGAVEHGADLVRLVHVLHTLEDHGEPLEAETGVDVLVLELAGDVEVVLRAHRGEAVLHEHEVPDLDVAGVVRGRAAVDAVRGAAVVEDLRAGAARAGLAGVPVVVLLAHALDALGTDAHVLAPDALGLVVLAVHGDPEALGVQAEAAVLDRGRQQLPGHRDGRLLEVVAEGEVAAHLEEGAVADGLADLLDVRGADALLHRDDARARRGLLPQEVRDERDHAGHREQQRRIRRDERRRRHHAVPPGLEEGGPAAGDLLGLHAGVSFCVVVVWGRAAPCDGGSTVSPEMIGPVWGR